MIHQPPPVASDDIKNRAAASGSYTSVPQNAHISQAYHQSHGYGHTYHPPPQYHTTPSPSSLQPSLGSGIHYTYLLLMALAFATVVQITKGGLFATQMIQKPSLVYPAVVPTTNLRNPNMFNNYYGQNTMTTGMMMPGMMTNNNPNMMNNNMYQNNMMGTNPNMMTNNNPNMMMNAANIQQGQQQQQTVSATTATTSAVADEASISTVASTEAAVAAPDAPTTPDTVETTTAAEPVADSTPAATETSTTPAKEDSLPELVIKPPKSTGNGEALENLKLSELSNFKDNWEEWEPSDTPIFFHIPKAGGECFALTTDDMLITFSHMQIDRKYYQGYHWSMP